MKFDFLINIIFSHEYYNECIPSEIFEIEPRRTNRVVLGGPKYPFRQTGRNQYALIGDREELLDHLSISPDGLNLEFQAHSKDPNFLLYTQSLLPEELNDSDIQLSVIDNRDHSCYQRIIRNEMPNTERNPLSHKRSLLGFYLDTS